LVELVIDTVVCLTLAKWETVSGQFGGYLRCRLLQQSSPSRDESSYIFHPCGASAERRQAPLARSRCMTVIVSPEGRS
jgi:hypothetical protein